MEDVGGRGSCRGGGRGVKEEVTLITGPILQPDTAVFPQWRTLACPLEWKGNVNIQESIFGRMWGVSLEVVGEGGRWGCGSNKKSEAERGWSVSTYVGAGRSWGLVLLEALLWSCVHWLGKQSTSASLCSSAPLAVEVGGSVLCVVTGCWDAPGWGFEDGSSPSPQKDLLRESVETVKHNTFRHLHIISY